MSDTLRCNNSAEAGSRPSRLQRRRPASLQISPASSSSWIAAIPLLSPLITSPTDDGYEVSGRSAPTAEDSGKRRGRSQWCSRRLQHPGPPFCYGAGSV
ncbi:hypothetical protein NC651_020956 [Populus alba x Populus x berolinensis]|nr:hypothetical protein NC651_020956 [Populus alba x Populus x berolinensis]